LDHSLHEFKKTKLLEEIDRALDEGDHEKFLSLTEKLAKK